MTTNKLSPHHKHAIHYDSTSSWLLNLPKRGERDEDGTAVKSLAAAGPPNEVLPHRRSYNKQPLTKASTMTDCEKTYSSLAKSLIDDIVTTPDPSSERAVDILAALWSESNKNLHIMTISILESTNIEKVLTKTVNACKRQRRRTRNKTVTYDDDWDKAITTAETLLSYFKKAVEAEKLAKNSQNAKSLDQGSGEDTSSVMANFDDNAKSVSGSIESDDGGDGCKANEKFVVSPTKSSLDGIDKTSDSSNEDITPNMVNGNYNSYDFNGSSVGDKDGNFGESEDRCIIVKDKSTIYCEDTLPQSIYKVAQRVYAKDDTTGLLYPAFVRKVMWGPKADTNQRGFCSPLAFGDARGGDDNANNENQCAGENDQDDEEEDEDARRWGPKRNSWHYYVHFMGWAVKWDRWVQEEYLYEDSAFTVALSKLLTSEYNKVKPKKKGQKMSLSQMNTWMKRMIELEAEQRMAERDVNTGGCEEGKCDTANDDCKVGESKISDTENANCKYDKEDETMHNKTRATMKMIERDKSCKPKQSENLAIGTDPVVEDAMDEEALQVTTAMLRKQAQLLESGLEMKHKKLLSDQLTLPFNLKKILVEEWEVITRCNMVHNVPSNISVREALDRYLESKLEPLRMEHEEESSGGNVVDAGGAGDAGDETSMQVIDKSVGRNGKKITEDGEQNLGKEWIDMVEGIALFFDQALPVNLLFAEERGQYASLRRQILAQRRNSVAAARAASVTLENRGDAHSSAPSAADTGTASSEPLAAVPASGDGKSPPHNFLPERMSEVYGCEHLLRLFLRLPGVVAESPTMTGMESRRIFSKVGDLVRYLQKNQSLFQSSFRKPLAGEMRRSGGVGGMRASGK